MTRMTRRIQPDTLLAAASVIKCLGHPLRLRLLEALESGEKTVTELQAFAQVSQAAVSEQLGILRGHNIVGARRQGTFVHYQITESKVHHILACIRECDVANRGKGRSA